MMNQEDIEKKLIQLLREQADRLESGVDSDRALYKIGRHHVSTLEDVLELSNIDFLK